MFAKFNVIMLAGAVFAVFCFVNSASADGGQSQPADDGQLFSIEGKILPPSAPVPPQGASAASQSPPPLPFAMETTEIVVNGRKRVGFVRPDGSFSIPGLPAGSHLVEVACPNYFFEPVKVDISSKGKFRARKVNLVQPSQVVQVAYPLKMKPLGAFRYFQIREQWRVTDFLYSPMVLMMVVPLILVMVLPKLMSDPETRKEMEQMQMPKYDMPELSEMMTSWFGGEAKKQSKPAIKQANPRRRQQ
jgi:hypothetical protein